MHGMKKDDVRMELVNNLACNLGNAVVFTFKAQGHHWNVEGSDFSEFHRFFGEIYEEVQDSIDPMAESIRKMDVKAPFTLHQFLKMSNIQDPMTECSTVRDMVQDLYDSNQVFLENLKRGYELSEKACEYGTSDFYSGRIDVHMMWQWQLRSHLKGLGGAY